MKRKQAHKQGLLRDFCLNQWDLLADFAKSSMRNLVVNFDSALLSMLMLNLWFTLS